MGSNVGSQIWVDEYGFHSLCYRDKQLFIYFRFLFSEADSVLVTHQSVHGWWAPLASRFSYLWMCSPWPAHEVRMLYAHWEIRIPIHNAILSISYNMSHDIQDFVYTTHLFPTCQYSFFLPFVIFLLFSTSSGSNSKYFSFEKLLAF